jgi:hypothetical protein
VDEVDAETGETKTTWKEEEFSTINFIATKVPKLGSDHPMHPGLKKKCVSCRDCVCVCAAVTTVG